MIPPVLSAQEEFLVADHPRLLMRAGEEQAIHEMIRKDTGMARIHDGIIRGSDCILGLPVLERVMEGKRLLHTSREALRRIFWLSYSFRMTGNLAYADRAIEEMLAVCAFSDWNPSHFLDVGEMVMAVAVGYDWLYETMTLAERSTVGRAILEKGFIPADDEIYAGFYNLANNWNQVCCSGLLFGALATYEEHPEMSHELIDLYVKSVPFALACYAPDGGYPEGFNYWGYGTSFQVLMIDALESALGTDFGLSEAPGFMQTGSFIRFMTTPGGGCFSFSDSPARGMCNPMMFWFAARNDDPSLVYLERRIIESLPEGFMADADKRFSEYRLLPALPIFASRMDMDHIEPPEETSRTFKGKTPLYIYRSGWESPDDTYLGIKGGSPMTSHAHMDAGSFVYEHDGVRWSTDLGMQDYHSLESRGVDLWNQEQNGQRWDVFRLGNEAHSTLTLNGGRHKVKSFAPITEVWNERGRKGARVDLTETFSDQADSVVREIWLDRKDRLHVMDHITAGIEDVTVQWVMTTLADAEIISDNEILLSKDGKRMRLKMTPGDGIKAVKAQIWPNDPPHDYDAPNPGTCRVGFVFTVPAHSDVTASVTSNI